MKCSFLESCICITMHHFYSHIQYNTLNICLYHSFLKRTLNYLLFQAISKSNLNKSFERGLVPLIKPCLHLVFQTYILCASDAHKIILCLNGRILVRVQILSPRSQRYFLTTHIMSEMASAFCSLVLYFPTLHGFKFAVYNMVMKW